MKEETNTPHPLYPLRLYHTNPFAQPPSYPALASVRFSPKTLALLRSLLPQDCRLPQILIRSGFRFQYLRWDVHPLIVLQSHRQIHTKPLGLTDSIYYLLQRSLRQCSSLQNYVK